LAKTISKNFSDLLEENNVLILGSEESCVIVNQMSLVIQLQHISAGGPTSIQCTQAIGANKTPQFKVITALQDDTAPIKVYQVHKQLVGSNLKDLASSLSFIHKQILGDISESLDLVNIPVKKYMSCKGAWK
jgi:hypothetical protein